MDLKDLTQIVGTALLISDQDDIGKIDRLHHWQYGFLLLAIPEILELWDDDDDG